MSSLSSAPSTESTLEKNLTFITAPKTPVIEVISTEAGLKRALASLKAGSGPFAVDTEFSQGTLYDERALLIQIRRKGSGTWIIDAHLLGDLSVLNPVLNSAQVIIHAAAQDILALYKRNIVLKNIFDTEFAAKLLGHEKTSLVHLLETYLSITLAKNHQREDWSVRPLPKSWVDYATLDVEYLLQLAHILEEELIAAGKASWFDAEMIYILSEHLQKATSPDHDQWRKITRLSQLKTRKEYGIAKALWIQRDSMGQSRDVHPKKNFSDKTIIALAQKKPQVFSDMFKIPGVPRNRHDAKRLLDVMREVYLLRGEQLPSTQANLHRYPPINFWSQKNPEGSTLAQMIKIDLATRAEHLTVPVSILIKTETVRSLIWDFSMAYKECKNFEEATRKDEKLHGLEKNKTSYSRDFSHFIPVTEEKVINYLKDAQVRPWQIEHVAPLITTRLASELEPLLSPQ